MRVTIFDRKNLHVCVVCQRVIKTDGLPIHQDSIHFRMRDAARFDDILDRGFFVQTPFDRSIAGFRVEKKIQVAPKAKADYEQLHAGMCRKFLTCAAQLTKLRHLNP